MEEEVENQADEADYTQALRQARSQSEETETPDQPADETESGAESESGLSEDERGRAALNIMTYFDVAGDLFGWVPFLGGIVRFVTGVGAVVQSFKIHPAIRVKAWIINGIMALIEMLLSLIGLNILPMQTIGAFIIRMIAGNAKQEKTKPSE